MQIFDTMINRCYKDLRYQGKHSLFSELAGTKSQNQATCKLGVNVSNQTKQEALEEKPGKGMLCKFFALVSY